MASILVAHPDPRTAQHFADATTAWRYRTRLLTDLTHLVRSAAGADIVILGHLNTAATAACIRELLETVRTEVIALERDAEAFASLKAAGADRCIDPKTGRRELRKIIRATLSYAAYKRKAFNNPDMQVGAFRHNPVAGVIFVNGIPRCLTKIENRLLRCLYRRHGEVVRHHHLIAAGWPHKHAMMVGRAHLRLHIYNLRRKLDQLGPDAPTIDVTPFSGYRLVPKGQDDVMVLPAAA